MHYICSIDRAASWLVQGLLCWVLARLTVDLKYFDEGSSQFQRLGYTRLNTCKSKNMHERRSIECWTGRRGMVTCTIHCVFFWLRVKKNSQFAIKIRPTVIAAWIIIILSCALDKLTKCIQSQLSTHDSGIRFTPVKVTHCSPSSTNTVLHTACSGIVVVSIHQPHRTICAI